MVICYVRLAKISETELGDIDVLEPSERVRMTRFAMVADRLRFITGRRLARQLVAELTHRTPIEIVVRMRCVHCGSRTHGKPHAVHPVGRLPLSIAHSGERVLVATTTGPDVGVDIEMIDETRFNEQVLNQIESPLERGRSPRVAAAFTRLWAHKEAVLKCTGEGLTRSPNSFSIDFSCNPPSIVGWTGQFAPSIGLASLDVADGYAAAVAVRGTREFRVELR